MCSRPGSSRTPLDLVSNQTEPIAQGAFSLIRFEVVGTVELHTYIPNTERHDFLVRHTESDPVCEIIWPSGQFPLPKDNGPIQKRTVRFKGIIHNGRLIATEVDLDMPTPYHAMLPPDWRELFSDNQIPLAHAPDAAIGANLRA